MLRTKYQGVCISVKDVNLSKEFYQDLFELEVFQDYGINIAFSCGISLQQGFDQIVSVPKETVLKQPHNMELYFETDDIDAFSAQIKRRNDIKYLTDGVKEATWGQRYMRFYDLDGHLIEVGENIRMVVKRFLDSGMTMDETSKRMDVTVADLEILLSS